MEKDKSPIHSTSISMGVMSEAKQANPVSQEKPAVLMIFGDFGYRSDSAQRISAAQWNDFFESNKFEITCSIEKDLPEYIKPFYLEYTVQSIDDFSIENVIGKTPFLSPFRRAVQITEQLKSSKITRSDAYSLIEKLAIQDTLKNKMFIGLGLGPTRDTPSSSPHQIDSILSMMEIQQEPQLVQNSKTDAFISAISSQDSNEPEYDKIISLFTSILTSTAEAIRKTDRFAEIATSWNSLKSLLKIVGRNQSVQVYCASSSREEASTVQSSILSDFPDDQFPDLLLWNYDYTFSTASIQELEQISLIAEKYKTILCTSIKMSDKLNTELQSAQAVRILMEEEEMIPFNRFRNTAAARSCVLCTTPRYSSDVISNEFGSAAGAWIIASQWVTAIIESATPFQWPRRIQSVKGFRLTDKIDDSRIEEAASFGITITENSDYLHAVRPVSVLNISEESPYRSAGFNMLVNKTARLTVTWVSGAHLENQEDSAAQLTDFLVSNLKSFNILSDERSLSVEISNNVATIDFDSQCSIDGFGIYFQFSINL
jgi:predicted component of type VI protein secretion system